MAPLLEMQHGVFYIADTAQDEAVLKLLASYAYRKRKSVANEFRLGEGIVGQCAFEKQSIVIRDVPTEYVKISSGLGEAAPRNIVVLPVLFEGQVKAVIELASFTSAYLAHQDLEERVVMPALFEAIGFDGALAINQAIVSNIPPDQMAATLSIMLPAMNIDDRTELLGGMKMGAPAEVFQGVWALAGTVLTPPDYAALGTRLAIA